MKSASNNLLFVNDIYSIYKNVIENEMYTIISSLEFIFTFHFFINYIKNILILASFIFVMSLKKVGGYFF